MRCLPAVVVVALVGCTDPPTVPTQDPDAEAFAATALVLAPGEIVPDINGDGYDDYRDGDVWWSGDADLVGEAFDPEDAPPVEAHPDFNGDGVQDSLVRYPLSSGTYYRSGYVRVNYGDRALPTGTVEGLSSNASFGDHIYVMDANGDGYDDLVVAAPDHQVSDNITGAFYVFVGGPTGLDPDPAAAVENDLPDREFAEQFTHADFNGDGIDDLVVSEYSNYNAPDLPRVLVFVGSPTQLYAQDRLILTKEGSRTGWGRGVQVGGDVDGDGNSDLIIPGDYASPGTLWVTGEAGSVLTEASFPADPVNFIADYTGDGVDEIYAETDDAHRIYRGGQDFSQASVESLDVGSPVSSAGDVNGDGYVDFVGSGRVRAGGADGPRSEAALIGTGKYNTEFFVDVDHDGLLDEIDQDGRGIVLGTGESIVVRYNQPLAGPVYWAGDRDGDGADEFYFLAQRSYGNYDVPHRWVTSSQSIVQVYSAVLEDLLEEGVDVGDIDNDGYSDIVYNGNLYEASEEVWAAAGFHLGAARHLVLPRADWNGDGIDDLVTGMGVWLGGATPQQTLPEIPFPVLESGEWGFAADLDGDGASDVIRRVNGVADFTQVLMGNGSTPLTPVALTAPPLPSGASFQEAFHDLDGDGQDEYVQYQTTNGTSLANRRIIAFTLDTETQTFVRIIDELQSGSIGHVTEMDNTGFALGSVRFEDADADGTWDHIDCDANDPTIVSQRWFADEDGDGQGDAINGLFVWHCGTPAGWTTATGDCDDTNPDVKTGATELCNGIDDNCDGFIDVGVEGYPLRFQDQDGDGFGGGEGALVCPGVDGWIVDNTDCNDASAAVNPGQAERCNGIDDDCNALVDDGILFGTPDGWGRQGFYDADGDGAAGSQVVGLCDADDPTVLYDEATDCNDDNAEVSPTATEVCDSVDNNCDGLTDIDAPGQPALYRDDDTDGYGAGDAVGVCPGVSGFVSNNADCDDADAGISPAALELCNGVDDDCNGATDDGYILSQPQEWARQGFLDLDGDGAAGTTTAGLCDVTDPAVLYDETTDCDDTDASISPGATEICDGKDNDCDGMVDVGVSGEPQRYRDLDGDSFGAGEPAGICDTVTGWVANDTDCDDANDAINPGQLEACNGTDDNCNGDVDEGIIFAPFTSYARIGLYDADGDGAAGNVTVAVCLADDPTVLYDEATDCDDTNADVSPAATEVCDGIDNDCDGTVDVGVAGEMERYKDRDGDGYGGGAPIYVCAAVADDWFVAADDCDDNNWYIHPRAWEQCDGVDQDCDGDIDEGPFVNGPGRIAVGYVDFDGDGEPGGPQGGHCYAGDPSILYPEATDCDDTDPNVVDAALWYRDVDQDGYGDANDAIPSCTDRSPAYVPNNNDCNDQVARINPAAEESCNGVDNNCNGIVDDNPTTAAVSLGYPDRDGDGAHGGALVSSCEQDDQTLQPVSVDCDDDNAAVHPGAEEVCNGMDDDCDRTIDGATATDAAIWFYDADQDGFGMSDVSLRACFEPLAFTSVPGDCDDTDSSVNPQASEVWYDGIDQDCDGNDVDRDGDGVPNGADCNDDDPTISPLASEIWYDGVDQDCDGNDDDFDRDGYGIAEDCDDTRGDRNPGATEIWYDTVDQNCDGNDLDQDNDGLPVVMDCDDEDPDNVDTCGLACSSVPSPMGLWLLSPVLLLLTRRRFGAAS